MPSRVCRALCTRTGDTSVDDRTISKGGVLKTNYGEAGYRSASAPVLSTSGLAPQRHNGPGSFKRYQPPGLGPKGVRTAHLHGYREKRMTRESFSRDQYR